MWHIGRVLGFGGALALLLAVLAPGEVSAQKKKATETGTPATPADYASIQGRKELVGTIVNTGGKSLTIRVDTPHFEPNPKYKPPTVTNPNQKGYNNQAMQGYRQFQQAQNLQRQLQQAQNARTPQEKARAMQSVYRAMAQQQQQMQRENQQLLQRAAKDPNYKKNVGNNSVDPFIVVHSYKDYELDLTDNVPVRKMFLPVEFDDMGNVKVYSDKEKAALKADDKSKLGGYKSHIGEAAPGMEARLTLIPVKAAKKAAKADDDGVGNVDRPTISAIILTKDSAAVGTIPGANPKKKDKK